MTRRRARATPSRLARTAAALGLLAALGACHDDHRGPLRERFATSPFAASAPRWCERYHHAHFAAPGVRFTRSGPASAAECDAGVAAGRALSCAMAGCDACDCTPPCSPCAKAGDPNGNAVLMTTSDAPGTRRVAIATFTIEGRMPAGSHVGLYVALHPHCHTTVQGLLVADAPGRFHLNVAAIDQAIGGKPSLSAGCGVEPFGDVSPPLATDIALREGERYRWRLAASLDGDGRITVATRVSPARGGRSSGGRYRFTPPRAARWFGAAGGASRYGFGAQFTRAASPSGGEPALRLLEFVARPAPLSAGSG